ncbi:hypothetical protein GQ53DRAFT_751267 [Thozetella sp. PMI_491]|nr:hypothetical protein GQ53DRAFT_751267 [Thozetella sp. PMI_491]
MDKFRPEPDKLRTEQNKPRPDQNKMRPDLDKFRPDQDKYRRKDRRDTVSTVREEIDMYSRIPPLDPRTGENRHGLGIQPQNFI